MAALPCAVAGPRDRGGRAQPLLIVDALRKRFPVRGGWLNAARSHLGNHTRQPAQSGTMPPGCAFAPRCRYAMRACTDAEPPVARPAEGVMVRCIRVAEPVPA